MPENDVLTLLLPKAGEVPLRFARIGSEVFVISSDERVAWASTILALDDCLVRTPEGIVQRVRARLETDDEKVSLVRTAFRQRLGPKEYDNLFSSRGSVIALAAADAGPPLSVHERIRNEFDAAASVYTARVQSNPVEEILRVRSRALLRRMFSGRDPILELGSGTGLETLPLLADGHRVTVVDISSRMLEELGRRARSFGYEGRLTTVACSLQRLHEGLSNLPDGMFAAGFSTFGALNIEPDLEGLSRTLGRVIRSDGVFVAGVLNRRGVTALAFAPLARAPGAALDRYRERIPVGRSHYPLEVFPTTPREFAHRLSPEFRFEGLTGASVLAPPVDLPRLRRWLGPRALQRLREVDDGLVRSRGWPQLGEWVLLVFRRK
ncbi:MAG: class I SAM-dependent methyltransferase [Thermoplasmata archaeon]